MDKQLRKYLNDILDAITEIEDTSLRFGRRYDVFQNDYVFRKFVERNIEIMGEAMNRILKVEPEINISHARKVVDTRNYVIHGYDSLMPEILWAIVINHLPLLKDEVLKILESSYE